MTERRDPYLDALEQLNTMRDRAFKAEDAVRRVRDVKRRTKNIYKDGFDVGWNACLATVLCALDGDGDE